MPIELRLRDSARLALAIAAAFPLGVQAAGAGRIDYVSGTVSALAPDGRSRALAKGAEINPGETIDTGSGRAQVRFSDGAQVSLQPQSQFRVDDYKFAGRVDGSETGFFSLLKGGMRTITGLIGSGNRQNYKVTTNVATIGIRGTEFVISYGNGITVSTGEGVVEVCNAAGCLILNSGDSAVVVDNTTSPVRTEIRATTTTDTTTPSVRIDYTKADEGLSSIADTAAAEAAAAKPKLVSGSGYAMAMAGAYNPDGLYAFRTGSAATTQPSGTANFDASSQLKSFDGSEGFQSTTIAGGFTDGTIGWGRWTSGTTTGYVGTPLADVHYIVGKPTPSADFTGSLANMQGTYSLTGYTLPTAFTNAGVTSVGSSGITGSFSARFTQGTVNFSLNNISVAGQTYTMSSGWTSGFTSSSINFTSAVTGGGLTGGTANVQGYFIGANAARAGLVYQFVDGAKTIGGATAFSQTGLTSYVPPQ